MCYALRTFFDAITNESPGKHPVNDLIPPARLARMPVYRKNLMNCMSGEKSNSMGV